MKKTLLLSLFLFSGVLMFGQTSGGPDAYGYTWANSKHAVSPPAFKWFDITTIGTPVTGLADDNFVGPFALPGGFDFYWYNVTQFWIGSNGYLSFRADQISSGFPASIPLSSGANDWIGMMLSDLNFDGAGNTGECYLYTSPDTICVSYINVPFWSVGVNFTGSNTFQVILNRADSSITFNYLEMDMGVNTGLDNLIGIENINGGVGLAPMIDSLPPDSLTIKFKYPSTVTYSANDAGVNWIGNSKSGGVFIKRHGSMELTSNIKNFGTTNLGSFTVNNTVKNSIGGTITSGSLGIPALPKDSDTTVIFSNTFDPTNTGIYTYDNTVSGVPADVSPFNDLLDQEVNVIDTNSNLMTLDYSDGTADGGGLGWNGGNGGIGIYIEPPMHPVRIVSSRFHISANATPPVGFYAKIYDDNGPNGGPGTLLDSVFRPAATVSVGSYNVVPTDTNDLLLLDGGVYLLWQMDGANINLARDLTPPISRRTFEVLYNAWAPYRDMLTEDFLLGIDVVKVIPKANFSADASLDPEVSFTDLSTNKPTDWIWDFGDGSPLDNTQHPTHTYTTIDTFEVCLTVSNFAGTDAICKDVIINNIPPTADFAFNTANAPTISFTDLSTNNPTRWHWDFGDGDTSNLQNTVHTYDSNGVFNVCLTAYNHAGPSVPFCQQVEIGGIGIDELSVNNALKVYPNPVNGSAFIELDQKHSGQNLTLKCFDLRGKEVNVSYEVVQGGIRLNTTGLSSGSYLFEVFGAQSKVGGGRFMVN